MTIVEFLTARLDEEAELAQRVADRYHRGGDSGEPYWPLPSIAAAVNRYSDPDIRAGFDLIGLYGPDRVLADIASKRRMAERAWLSVQYLPPEMRTPSRDAAAYDAFWVLAELASVYSTHPDYNPEWRP